ncbi:DUF1963 domain-containing protein [Priestia aryabhattai]|nr:DUF1963 domain-containing protein [Priestia aryabhattai]
MDIYKIVKSSYSSSPFYFGGDSAYIAAWPKNPDGQDLLLLFTINCEMARQQLNRTDLPEAGFLHVFSTYDKDDYFLDSLTFDEIEQKKGVASYTCVIHTEQMVAVKSTGLSIPLQYANFEASVIQDEELSVASLVSTEVPAGAVIPKALESSFNFFCQVYSSDFPVPFQDALYMTDAVGYLFINKQLGDNVADGCFFVQAG